MKPQDIGDATGFQDLGGGVRETENVRERREEPPQVLGFRDDLWLISNVNGGLRRREEAMVV